eukprot:scaffold39165_cov180-Skeletonema_marinoi.AAC.1
MSQCETCNCLQNSELFLAIAKQNSPLARDCLNPSWGNVFPNYEPSEKTTEVDRGHERCALVNLAHRGRNLDRIL